MKSNSEIKELAFQSVTSAWLPAVLATFIYSLISLLANMDKPGYISTELSDYFTLSSGLCTILFFLLALPLGYAYTLSMLDFYRGDRENALGNMFGHIKNDYTSALSISVLRFFYEALWALLFIIPGFVKHYSYGMSFYILRDNPDLTAEQSIRASMELMDGHKMDLFLLDLSFIGWFLLGIITAGLGFLFINPYIENAHAAFYESLIEDKVIVVKE